MPDGQVKEKFVWDNIFDISKLSGLFQVTTGEIEKISSGSHYFRESYEPISTRDRKDPSRDDDDVYTLRYEDGTVLYRFDAKDNVLVSFKMLEFLRRFLGKRIEAQPDIKPEKE